MTDIAQQNEELREIPAETRRTPGGWRQGGVPTERSEDFGGAVRRLGQLLRPDWPRLALIVVMALASTVLNVLGPRVLGRATDVVIDGLRSGRGIDFPELHHVLYEAIALYVGAAVLGVGIALTLAGVVQRLMFGLRQQAEAKINSLPLRYIDRQARGDLLSRVTNDLDNLAQTLQQTLSQMLTSVLLLIGVAVMMISISPLLALVALVTVPGALWSMKVIGGRARPKFIEQWRSTGELNAQIEETFTGHAIVKAFGRQQQVESRFNETNEVLYQSSFGAQFMSSLMQPSTMFFGNLQYVIVAVVGGLRVATGAISIGDVQAFIQYSRQFAMPLTQLASMMNMFQSGIASLERVIELLDAEEQTPDGTARLSGPVEGRVVFDDVSLLVRPRSGAHRGPRAGGRTGGDHRHRRAHRGRQDHVGEPDHAVLRARRRLHHPRRRRHRQHPPGGAALPPRHGAAGHVALRRDHPGEHRLRQPRRHRGADPRGREGLLRRPVRPPPPRRLRHRDQRGGRQHQRRSEAAPDHRPGLPRRPLDPHPRRGDLVGGHPDRGARSRWP